MPLPNQSVPDHESISRLPAVVARTGLSKNSIARLVKVGDFPVPIRIAPHSIGFINREIDAWIRSRPRTSETHNG
jgi:prophage regulatory protein